jgi:DNA-directed RNA polymerase specialized sigma24 family protein
MIDWGATYEHENDLLVGFAIKICGLSETDAQDAVQDAWVEAMEHESIIENPARYLRLLVRRAAGSKRRKIATESRAFAKWATTYAKDECGDLAADPIHEDATGRLLFHYDADSMLRHVVPPLGGAQGGPEWRGRRTPEEDRARNNALKRAANRRRRDRKARGD